MLRTVRESEKKLDLFGLRGTGQLLSMYGGVGLIVTFHKIALCVTLAWLNQSFTDFGSAWR